MKIKKSIVRIVGVLLAMLIFAGVACIIWKPEASNDYWGKVIPIISVAMGGLIVFVTGREKH